ncbi:hypothetical protein BO82DRAFT_53805 [Aspergillus uvarum CBS 121591]|uniref:Uncharacterized protein n=1 Tax=Aspergillus uvarum CBS 121591 TaxID=1448315 RepID=A0A319CNZ1_9EURO|nr:hypothetical protein BO82DRAFT_53805 [Aspergillus uvarum CBS 121591]PYH86904.1 hypothetical protein BO82DRAFT_53805 [Aspergillus uvarum CBS 121591]
MFTHTIDCSHKIGIDKLDHHIITSSFMSRRTNVGLVRTLVERPLPGPLILSFHPPGHTAGSSRERIFPLFLTPDHHSHHSHNSLSPSSIPAYCLLTPLRREHSSRPSQPPPLLLRSETGSSVAEPTVWHCPLIARSVVHIAPFSARKGQHVIRFILV